VELTHLVPISYFCFAGLGAQQAKKLCPPDIEVAFLIGHNFCILSGPAEIMNNFMETLQEQGVFTMEINCDNIAYHSKHISSAGPLLLKYLEQVKCVCYLQNLMV
jgi:hypothetical protein